MPRAEQSFRQQFASSRNTMVEEIDVQEPYNPQLLAPGPSSIGDRLGAQLDALSLRQQRVREIQELATYPVVELTTEQLRRILEFMV